MVCLGDLETLELECKLQSMSPYHAWTENTLTRGRYKAGPHLAFVGRLLTEPGLSPLDELGSLLADVQIIVIARCTAPCLASVLSAGHVKHSVVR